MTVELHGLIEETLSGITTVNDMKSVLFDDQMFETYLTRIKENIPAEVVPMFETFARITRDRIIHPEKNTSGQLLTEAAEIVNNGQALAITLVYFPVIAELYSKPILTQLLTPWMTDEHGRLKVAIKRRLLQVVDGNGNVIKEYEIPAPIDVDADLKQTKTVNIDEVTSLYPEKTDPRKFRIIANETAITKVYYTDSNGNKDNVQTYLEVVDRKGENIFIIEGTVTIPVGNDVNIFRINAEIDARKGTAVVGKTVIQNPSNLTITSVDIAYIATSIDNSGKLRKKITEDIKEISRVVEYGIPYEVETDIWLDSEFSQYDINYLSELAQKVREQILLEKDVEIANALKRKDAEIVGYKHTVTVDFNNMPAQMNPANPKDVYMFLMSAIYKLSNILYDDVYIQPKYILVNPKDAHMLESFVEISSVWGGQMSKINENTGIGATRFVILKSRTIPQGTMYLVAKAPGRDNPVLIDAILRNAPIITTTKIDVKTKVTIVPNSKVIFIDPKKVGKITIQNAPSY